MSTSIIKVTEVDLSQRYFLVIKLISLRWVQNPDDLFIRKFLIGFEHIVVKKLQGDVFFNIQAFVFLNG